MLKIAASINSTKVKWTFGNAHHQNIVFLFFILCRDVEVANKY